MKKDTDYLTGLILHWQQNGTGYTEIIREVSKIVLEYPRLNGNWDADKCSEFYIFFHRRMLKLIHQFEYRGMSFKSLLRNTLSWQMASFYRNNHGREQREYCLRYDSIIQAEVARDSGPPENLAVESDISEKLNIEGSGRISTACKRRRLLMLALKNANYLDEAYIEKISELTGCSHAWLLNAVTELRLKNLYRMDRLRVYRERANRTYLELCRMHRELERCTDSRERTRLLAKIDTLKTRLERASRGGKSVMLNPTNNEIAEIMCLPKGSVDSGLYLLKKDLTTPPVPDDASD